MTSMPASRSALAITLAPRSWPSRPGLAMTTLSFRILGDQAPRTKDQGLDDGHFLVLAPHLAKRVAHFADGCICADRVEYRRHQVVGRSRHRTQAIERPLPRRVVAGCAQLLEPGELLVRGRVVDIQDLDRRL